MAHPVSARLTKAYTASAGRKFGLTIGAAFAVLGGIGVWRNHVVVPAILGSAAAILLLAALIAPTSLRMVEESWMKFAHALSRITTPIFMGVVYFVILTPVGFLRRSMGGNALVHRPVGSLGVWLNRADAPRSSLERLF